MSPPTLQRVRSHAEMVPFEHNIVIQTNVSIFFLTAGALGSFLKLVFLPHNHAAILP